MPNDPNCIFCKIVAGRIPCAKVHETESAVAFLDIAPIAPGHTLLVPKDHHATLAEIPGDVLAKALADLPRLARAVLQATGATGLNVVQNNGREAGQLVAHIHFHLIPRAAGDSIHVHWPHGKYEGTAMDDLCSRIAAAL